MLFPVDFTARIVNMGDAEDVAFLTRNSDLCRALNMTSLSVVLNDLVRAGMPKAHREMFHASAEALLELMRTENNRLWAQRTNPGAVSDKIVILDREVEQAALRFEHIEESCEKLASDQIGIMAETGKENCRAALKNTR